MTIKLTGHAALFNSPAVIRDQYGEFTETIRPGAFAKCLARKPDVRALLNHTPSALLGRTRSGTLSVNEDAKGLRFTVTLPDTSTGRDVAELVRRGDLTGCSFGFDVVKGTWDKTYTRRELVEVELFEVSLATFPAYDATHVGVAADRAARDLWYWKLRLMKLQLGVPA